MVTLVYNASKLAVDRIDKALNQKVASSDLDIRKTQLTMKHSSIIMFRDFYKIKF